MGFSIKQLLPSWRRRGPMNCAQVAKVLQHYLDGELDESRRSGLSAHLEQCRRCGLEAETYRQIKDSLDAGRPAVSDESLARLRDFAEGIARGEIDVGP